MPVLALSIIGLWIAGIAAFITHLWWSLSTLMGDAVLTVKLGVIMIAGIIVPPLGALHGIWLWFN